MKFCLALRGCVCLLAFLTGLTAVSLPDVLYHHNTITKQKSDSAFSSTWKDCGLSNGVLKVHDLDIYFEPAKNWDGPHMGVKVNISTAEDISGGTVHVAVSCYEPPTVRNYKIDMCDLLKDVLTSNGRLSCPLKQGTYTIYHDVSIAFGMPSGSCTGSANATDASGQELYCVSYAFNI